MLDWYVNSSLRRLEEEARERDRARRWWRYVAKDEHEPARGEGDVIEGCFGADEGPWEQLGA